ncbi:hypothetical protein HD554DRAFT_2131070 [Boletus coccyginus]|nr:hypothetical protein HD554DRAFT_2131070 [Boletus coccyginus]
MSSNSTWVPDEDSQTLFSERCWLQGVVVSAVAYGITVSLYLLSFHLLTRQENRVEFKKRIPLLIYITLTFLLGTIFMISLAAFTQMAFIDDRNYPGGPNAFENDMFSIPLDNMGNAAFTLSNWFCDALLVRSSEIIELGCLLDDSPYHQVWRFKVIYQMCPAPLWVVMLFPCLMLAGSVALGIMFLIQVSTTNAYVTNGVNFTLPYLSLSLALNIILTIAIVLRLLTFRYRVISLLGPKHGTQYTSIAAMIIESAALYSTVSITFLILFGIGNAVSQVFLQSLSQFQTIATFLIVFRVAQGKGWSAETATYVMTAHDSGLEKMRFAPGASVTLASSAGDTVKNASGVESQDRPNASMRKM